MNSITGLDGTQELLIKLLEQNPDDWGMRKKVVWFLYEAGYFREASKVVWNAPEIPPVDKEIVFAARVVSKGQPTRAMRLLNAVVERNRSEPEKNLAMAKELVKGGMPLQATRFYGAATLSDNTLIDEDFEICLITTDSEEEDWSEVVQSVEFPWEGPVELNEADLACEGEGKEDNSVDLMLSGLTQPVPLKAPVKSMKDTVKDDEKSVDLRDEFNPLPLNPDKISTIAVTDAVSLSTDDDEEEVEKPAEIESKNEDVLDKESKVDVVSEDEVLTEITLLTDEKPVKDKKKPGVSKIKLVEPLEVAEEEDVESDEDDVVSADDDTASIENDSDSADDASEEVDFEMEEPAVAKKGILSSVMGFFRRSKKNTDDMQSDADIFASSEPAQPIGTLLPPAQAQPTVKVAAEPKKMERVSVPITKPIIGPVKPKPVPVPAELKNASGRNYGQPEAIDCRTRLVALAPQDGSAFFTELSEKYATLSSGKMPDSVVIAKDEADVDYIDLIQKACNKDLDSFSKLLGLHAPMTEADCIDWVDDMNLLRKGYGDAVLATVVSKYSVAECREILGAVYRRTATQAAV